jgi:hypothetical protein
MQVPRTRVPASNNTPRLFAAFVRQSFMLGTVQLSSASAPGLAPCLEAASQKSTTRTSQHHGGHTFHLEQGLPACPGARPMGTGATCRPCWPANTQLGWLLMPWPVVSGGGGPGWIPAAAGGSSSGESGASATHAAARARCWLVCSQYTTPRCVQHYAACVDLITCVACLQEAVDNVLQLPASRREGIADLAAVLRLRMQVTHHHHSSAAPAATYRPDGRAGAYPSSCTPPCP